MVSEPLLGQIRLQWWQDSINKIYAGSSDGIQGHYIFEHIPRVILERGLSKSLFDQFFEARASDFSRSPPKNEQALVDYVFGTSAALNILLLETIGEKNGFEDKAAEVGIAWGLTGLIRALPNLAKQGRFPLPISLIAPDQNLSEFNNDMVHAIQSVCVIAKDYLDRSLERNISVSKVHRSVFLSSILTTFYLKQISESGYNPYSIDSRNGRVGRQFVVGVGALLGNY
jgi:phytoene synthase